MPNQLPTESAILKKEVSFFSIDTDIIQAYGFKFDQGALHVLVNQLPSWLTIKLTKVVEQEILSHQRALVLEALRKLKSAISGAKKHLDGIGEEIGVINVEKLKENAEKKFCNKIHAFLKCLGGEILPLEGDGLAQDIFEQYFSQRPPFEEKKKSEFPDAASLLLLESYAKKNKTTGIVISKDKGWANFTENSSYLYYAESLDELTAIFAKKDALLELIKDKIQAILKDKNSMISQELLKALESHVESQGNRVLI